MSGDNHPKPPVAPRQPHTLSAHGHERLDEYYWLRERENPEVMAYLEAENDYTEAVMRHTSELQEQLYQEMVGRIQQTDRSAPVKNGDYYYYQRTEAGLQYPIYCRKKGNIEAAEQVLLNLNELSEGGEYLRLGVYKISPDHSNLAYSLDMDGAELFELRFKDLSTGETFPDRIMNTSGWEGGEWGNDNRTFFYITLDETKRPYRLHRHTLGTPLGSDELLHQEDDGLFVVHLEKTKDRACLLLNISSKETAELRFLDANQPSTDLRVLHPRQAGHLYQVAHHGGWFYILSNEKAPNFKLMVAPADEPDKEKWVEHTPHREDVLLEGIELFAEHLVLYKRQNGLPTIGITRLGTHTTREVPFPEGTYAYERAENPEFDTHLLRFTYMSLTTPDSDYDYDMDTGEMHLRKRKPVLGGFDPERYATERIFATAADGTTVPISLVYRQGLVKDGRAPCLLYGYGAYGHCYDPSFPINQLSLIDRGFIVAIAHIRGGQEMGRYWYDQGKYLNKVNTFTDFIACARYLVAEKFTSHDWLAIYGRSAGGLLIGAVLNMAPDLCNAAFAGVPFVDAVTTMLDERIPLTVGEFEEWGNPQDKVFYDYMLSYSPYDNIAPREYPHLLVTAGLNDPRVQYWEPAKWVAKLRALKFGEDRLLLKTNLGAGHAGASGRYDYLREIAFEYAFILDALGV